VLLRLLSLKRFYLNKCVINYVIKVLLCRVIKMISLMSKSHQLQRMIFPSSPYSTTSSLWPTISSPPWFCPSTGRASKNGMISSRSFSSAIVKSNSSTAQSSSSTAKETSNVNRQRLRRRRTDMPPSALLKNPVVAVFDEPSPQKGFVYDKKPFKLKVEKHRVYDWCGCGLSHSQPLCDGTHLNRKVILFFPCY